MTESHCQTAVGIIKQSVKSSKVSSRSLKHNQIVNSGLVKDSPHENTSSGMVVRGMKAQKRKHLPFSMTVLPVFSLGSLRGAQFYIDGDSPYLIRRSDRFPRSVFQIDESTDKIKRYRLLSNFSGSKYNLFEGPEIILTISFESGFCREYPFRIFNLFYKASGVSFESLFKKNDSEDLQILYEYPDNKGKIKKMTNDLPNQNENGVFSMNFGREHVLPAVQNSVVLDETGENCMSMVKLGDNAFEVAWRGGVVREWCVAFALASLDFKWALQ